MLRRCVFLMLLLSLAACSNGRKIDYSQAYPEVPKTFAKAVDVQVIDERPYVLSGNKTGHFVGLIRGSYYIPYDVNTRSGEPLAQELQKSLLGGFERKGVKARAVDSKVSQASSADAMLLSIRVREWKSESFMGVVLTHALTADVFDSRGQRLASVPLQGSSSVYDFTDSGKTILSSVLARQDVQKALNGEQVEVVEAAEIEAGSVRRDPAGLFTPPVARDGVF
ncbi:hypothetical protein D16iCDA_10705 [Pseudomonas seleniipraecipitans]|uniref:Lipoprotein n=1 Tax=Phytopseudomonas seleniipraecipitans TaxID=640205 RepID=A0ABY5J5G7_9GAMM|nr:hypothetical protein [Pseudomonas seleniipraecipitans]UUD62184.1 hypothetical protein D16iCDA_10705 [Pseudomonas seleniipraecipitans]